MFKKIVICTLSILIITILSVFIPNTKFNNKSTAYAKPLPNKDLKDENTQLKYQIESLEGTISLLKDALNELGAASPNDAVNIWAKGIKTRNGYLQYYISCDKMKKQFLEELSKSEHISWVTGYSSPWVSSYDIVNIEKVNPLEYKYTIRFNWATSSGPYDSTKITVTTSKISNNWCISHIQWNDGSKKYIF